MDLSSDAAARVLVFIDGQNLYKTCKDLFGHPLCHPHLLAQHLAGPRQAHRVGCRFYTGRPDPEKEPIKTRNLDRRLDGMRKSHVTVVTRTLRYHWDWSPEYVLPRPGPNSLPQEAMLRPWQRSREKGIDLILALDVVELLLTGLCDVAVVVSLDQDLFEIPRALASLRRHIDRPFRVEAAVPVDQRRAKILEGFAYTHQITREVFEMIRDDHDYAAADEFWEVPEIPARLPPRPPAPVRPEAARPEMARPGPVPAASARPGPSPAASARPGPADSAVGGGGRESNPPDGDRPSRPL